MDAKTLSTIIGHVSSSATLNIYAHVTDEICRTAAVKIDRGIAKSETTQDIDTRQGNWYHPLSSPTKACGANPASDVSDRSMTTYGRGGTPLSGQTAKNTPAMSMPTARGNAKNC